ncbi:MAG: hypothetical protein HY000_13865 [Planctomycetes bacterium]|nr:hypothetical protein [Planctomycetota bacterium]
MKRCHVIANLAMFAALAAMLGCAAEEQAEVRGKVTLDGQPVEEGTISFIPSTGSQNQAAWAPIKGGEFVIDGSQGLATGVSRVEIRALRRTGRILPTSMPGEPEYEMQDYIPQRYNSASQLKAEIKPGPNQVDFELKSK